MVRSILVEDAVDTAPDFQIVDTSAAPPGWHVCYLTEWDPHTGKGSWMSLPVALWATVCYEGRQEIRPFVAWLSGQILDFQDNEHPFLCLVSPLENLEQAVGSVMANDEAIRAATSQLGPVVSDLPS